jgi:sigma-B regulation protein RsbU (phosphoserine phosphatase)
MADDEKKGDGKPPVLKPSVPPVIQPVSPPVVKPVTPPVMQPVKPPVVTPVTPPVVKPVTPPVVKPVAAPAPAPVEAPAPAPVVEPKAKARESSVESHHRTVDRMSGYTGVPIGVLLAGLLFLASLVAGAAAWKLAAPSADGAFAAVDEAGRAAARTMATMEFDWWGPDHGTAKEMRTRAAEAFQKDDPALKAAAEGVDREKLKSAVMAVLADRRGTDDLQAQRNRERFSKLGLQGALVGADLYDLNRRPLGRGTPMPSASLEQDGEGYIGTFQANAGGATIRGRLFLSPVRGRRVENGEFAVEGFAGVAISTEPAWATLEEGNRRALLAGAVVAGIGLFGCIVAWLLLGRLRPVLRDAEEYSRGNFDHRPSSPGGGEVGALGKAVARMALAAKDREAAALAKAAAASSGAAPADHRPVVAAALAPAAPLRLPSWEIEGTSRACVEIAGDVFDYSPAAKGRISCILVETSLRGLPAAFVAAEVKGLYRALAPSHDSASVLLDSIGAAVGPRLPEDAEIHATVCVADPDTGATEIARAGKANPPILWRADTKALEKIEVEGPPIRRKPSSAGHVEVDLRPRDRLSLVSDGLFRVRNSRKEKFGEQRLDGLVLKFGPMNSTAFVNMVVNEVDLFHEGASQRDDLTVLTVRRIK